MTEKTVKVGETVYTHEIRGWTKQYPGSTAVFMVVADIGAILTALYEAEQSITELRECLKRDVKHKQAVALAELEQQNAKLVECLGQTLKTLDNMQVINDHTAYMTEGARIDIETVERNIRQTLKDIEGKK